MLNIVKLAAVQVLFEDQKGRYHPPSVLWDGNSPASPRRRRPGHYRNAESPRCPGDFHRGCGASKSPQVWWLEIIETLLERPVLREGVWFCSSRERTIPISTKRMDLAFLLFLGHRESAEEKHSSANDSINNSYNLTLRFWFAAGNGW